MDDWTQPFQFVQSVFIGLIFSYLLAKLISVVVSFREEKLSIARTDSVEDESEPSSSSDPKPISDDLDDPIEENSGVNVQEPIERGTVSGDDADSDDDWEGVESTELDEAFSAATAFVAAAAADRLSQKVSSDLQLQLYGLYKIATEGPCTVPQPSAFKMTARAKWQAWQKLGAMPPEEAMQDYISIISELYPTWATGSTSKIKDGDSSGAPSGDNKGPMGPVFSTFIHEEESGNELKMDAIHAFAREGDGENLLKCIESGVPVDLKDSEGRTPLHWAVDRGHFNITELLLSKKADVNAKFSLVDEFESTLCVGPLVKGPATPVLTTLREMKAQDNEGQSALHYAAVCEREEIAEFLVKQNADTDLKDDDSNTAYDLCDLKWPWLQRAVP